jgi:hypothetical protein
MAPPFADLTVQRNIVRTICGYLCCEDIAQLTPTSNPIRRELLNDNPDPEKLVQFALACDGSSGIVAYVDGLGKRHKEAVGIKKIDAARAGCLTPKKGPIASKACQICGEPVCKVGHPRRKSHSQIQYFSSVSQKCRYRCFDTTPQTPAWSFDGRPRYKFDPDRLFLRRWKVFCDNCEPQVIAGLQERSETGVLKLCACRSLRQALLWVCAPCLKRMQRDVNHTSLYLCGSRRKMEECLGASSSTLRNDFASGVIA